MRQLALPFLSLFLTVPFLLTDCSSGSSTQSDPGGGKTGGTGGSSAATGGSTTGGTGGSTTGGTGGSTGGTTGGTSATGGTGGGIGGSTGGSTGGTGGSTGGTGGSTGGTGGGAGGAGGTTAGMGGMVVSTGGSAGQGTGGSGGSTGGSSGSAGMGGGAGASTCATMDQNGKANWMPGATTSTTRDYLRSCDIRLLNNNWGAQELNCSSSSNQYSVFVNNDGSFGWNFNRGDCDTAGKGDKPDFPEIEFGVHPFGKGSSLATSPDFSSTTLLPIQIKDIQSASVTINNLSVQLQQSASWDLTFEFWVSQRNPATDASPGVYAELMTFWGWQNGRWPECNPPTMGCNGPQGTGAGDQVTAGNKTYKLDVQSDTWANSQWRYFQFRSTDGPSNSFSGKLDVKALIDYLTTKRGYSTDYWISRFEVGTEIDDMTQGKATIDSITFEVNGQSRSAGKQ
jgi:hypothetical protein